MNILVTGAKGMVGTALVANLKNIKEGKNRTRPNIKIDAIYEYDRDNTYEETSGQYDFECGAVCNISAGRSIC